MSPADFSQSYCITRPSCTFTKRRKKACAKSHISLNTFIRHQRIHKFETAVRWHLRMIL
ncbi:uncharacterized protein B0H18DRAFT_1000742 [Fomitopsis serialis]|uniref:uncharacterized protein n=1 Tax=Fomitopsis serialis TaxID=139415 RepID=UPI002008D4F7|nr:uncharacterized protein B0H18DRAFT_1000742 [Neoantrodia serialis]KAH9928303.1 hypothetical protein B0H18DRAFT_1000742 [Neoantrodia serialis]